MNYKQHRALAWHAAEYVKQTRERYAIASNCDESAHALHLFANAVERAVKAQRELRNTELKDLD